jgi:hypothetical protein
MMHAVLFISHPADDDDDPADEQLEQELVDQV